MQKPAVFIGFVFQKENQIRLLLGVFQFYIKHQIDRFGLPLGVEINRRFGFKGFPIEQAKLGRCQDQAENIERVFFMRINLAEESIVNIFLGGLLLRGLGVHSDILLQVTEKDEYNGTDITT